MFFWDSSSAGTQVLQQQFVPMDLIVEKDSKKKKNQHIFKITKCLVLISLQDSIEITPLPESVLKDGCSTVAMFNFTSLISAIC